MRTVLVIIALAGAVKPSAAQDIPAADARGIRTISGTGPFLLTFLAVKRTSTPLDDRTVAEFPLAAVPPDQRYFLVLGIQNQDPDPPAGAIDVYWYLGDGVVTAAEFSAGTAFASFECGANGIFEVDVTPVVISALAQSAPFVGFRLSTVTADRYFLGSIAGQPEPLLRIRPFPCYANCDSSTAIPVLNVSDFICFQSRFAAGVSYADCDHSGALNVNDFLCFQASFAAGCP